MVPTQQVSNRCEMNILLYSQLGCSQPITALRYCPAFSYIGRLSPLRDGHTCHLVYAAENQQSSQLKKQMS